MTEFEQKFQIAIDALEELFPYVLLVGQAGSDGLKAIVWTRDATVANDLEAAGRQVIFAAKTENCGNKSRDGTFLEGYSVRGAK